MRGRGIGILLPLLVEEYARSDMDYHFPATSTLSQVFSNSILAANPTIQLYTSPPRPTLGQGHLFKHAFSFNSTASPIANSLAHTPNFTTMRVTTNTLSKKCVVPTWAYQPRFRVIPRPSWGLSFQNWGSNLGSSSPSSMSILMKRLNVTRRLIISVTRKLGLDA